MDSKPAAIIFHLSMRRRRKKKNNRPQKKKKKSQSRGEFLGLGVQRAQTHPSPFFFFANKLSRDCFSFLAGRRFKDRLHLTHHSLSFFFWSGGLDWRVLHQKMAKSPLRHSHYKDNKSPLFIFLIFQRQIEERGSLLLFFLFPLARR